MNDLKHYLDAVERIFAEETFLAEPTGLYEPIDYTLQLGGKRIRPTLLMIANAMFGGHESDVRDAAIGIELFHNFTLLHDDLMDCSPLRRGHPTVYRRWNENTAILSGDTMFALAWRYFLRHPSERLQSILQCFNETAIEVCEGQQYDMDFETNADVSLEQYMMMIRKKTAVLLAGALKIGALYAGAPESDVDKLYQFGLHLGLAFQLQDDLLDAYGDTTVFGKQTGQDIRDNKKTYLPLRALQLLPPQEANKLRTLFDNKDTQDGDEKVKQVKALYEQVNLRNEVQHSIEAEFSQATSSLNQVATAPVLKQPLLQLMDTLFDRKK